MVVADGYPNFSICGIPYYVSGEVPDWRTSRTAPARTSKRPGSNCGSTHSPPKSTRETQLVTLQHADGADELLSYDALIIGTGAVPIRPPIGGLRDLGPEHGVHLLHSMDDTFALTRTLKRDGISRAVIVGAGYIGLEMAEGLTRPRVSRSPRSSSCRRCCRRSTRSSASSSMPNSSDTASCVRCDARVDAIKAAVDCGAPLEVHATDQRRRARGIYPADVVLVVVGVRPDTELAAAAGTRARQSTHAIAVDPRMRTNLPAIFAAGDCAVTHHRLLGTPTCRSERPPTNRAGSRPRMRSAATSEFAGSLGTQVVKVFDLVAARTGLRDEEATSSRIRAAHGRAHRRRPQGLLPRQPPDPDALHGRPPDRPAPRTAARRRARVGDRQTDRRRRDRDPQRTDGRAAVGAGSVVHAAARFAVGCAADRRPSLDPGGDRLAATHPLRARPDARAWLAGRGRQQPWWVTVAILGLVTNVAYGVAYYSYGVLIDPITGRQHTGPRPGSGSRSAQCW